MSYKAEDFIDGILINPESPEDFDDTDTPYITTQSWDQRLQHSIKMGAAYAEKWGDPDPAVEAEKFENLKRMWFERYPSGVAYDVLCLDGGAWDRPTRWGSFGTLEKALQCAKAGPTTKGEP